TDIFVHEIPFLFAYQHPGGSIVVRRNRPAPVPTRSGVGPGLLKRREIISWMTVSHATLHRLSETDFQDVGINCNSDLPPRQIQSETDFAGRRLLSSFLSLRSAEPGDLRRNQQYGFLPMDNIALVSAAGADNVQTSTACLPHGPERTRSSHPWMF